ncbi:DUF3253 domain-containing protein [Pacificimonas sp. WHA3]|uniref:DUF3253 domain-containing protein n=1 Tax=Pacificimonas pallii TaxID=2827236 RepID=A0ABS6SGI1_9SPHN|nr:DUF3253 domain-containing protein [Pacificimonas pallii]MBV7257533.1 DUF3253 domain-containing protein [Pacificimonas pallii]
MPISPDMIRLELLRLAAARAPLKSFCPSEVARALWPDVWRNHMEAVRAEAETLVGENLLICTQGGTPVDIASAKGPIRLTKA